MPDIKLFARKDILKKMSFVNFWIDLCPAKRLIGGDFNGDVESEAGG